MNVLLYTKKTCSYCVRAKDLLKEKNVPFQEIDITDDPSLRSEMIKKAAGRTTVPQIFINGQHIGGCDDIYGLQRSGKLDTLLAS